VVERIISGGQTGVDRAALDAAIACGVPHAGWCPRGRRAEDGPIAAAYNLRETESPQYHVRTRLNVLDADGTLILHRGPLTGGTELTRKVAHAQRRPLLSVDLGAVPAEVALASIRAWLAEHRIRTLNVAGPRESACPGIAAQAGPLLLAVLSRRGCE
jgi:hypothetical protein